ncbi:MAG TPA: recombinase family protein [Ktedonobacterales bacterium]
MRRIQDIPAPRIAAIYCRVSSQQQSTEDRVSLDTQEAEARKWCAARGWGVDNEYIYHEVHTGEDLWQRKVLQQLLEDAKSRQFGLVLAHSVDRLSRDATAVHVGIITDQLDRAGVAFDFVTEAFEASPIGFLMLQVRGFAAGIENERRRERFMRATRAKAISGKLIPGGRPLYGYQWGPERSPLGKLTKERLVPDPVTAPIVVRIY